MIAIGAMMLVGAPKVVLVDNGMVRASAIYEVGEVVEELSVRDAKGVYRTILVSPTHPDLKTSTKAPRANLLRVSDPGLFDSPPSFRFSSAAVDGLTLTLSATIDDWKVTKAIRLPEHGNTIDETLTATTNGKYPQIRYLLNSYAFAPGKPDETWAPALRPGAENVIGDHFFRSPAAVIRRGSLGATMMPDLDTLRDNRPIPTVLDLDVASGASSVPLLSYGFCDHRLSAHVRYSHDASMVRAVPHELISKCEIRLDADAKPDSQLRAAADYMWARYGHGFFDKILPQTMPFEKYAELCYPAAFNEKMTGGWFERSIDGKDCGGVPAGWGLDQGWVSYQCWFNQLRSAWGVRWWGQRLNHADWVAKADKMLNLALAAPSDHGACPTTYMSKTNEWKGSLITPTADCYYDVPSIAWKGIWYLRWLKFTDCPRRAEVERQAESIFGLMKRVQNSDGSFPSWLTKDLKVVPMLDRSAQSGLPAWFVGEYGQWHRDSLSVAQRDELQGMLTRCNSFLTQQVLPERLYYDFETFFSCSPKVCLQKDGAVDNKEMWDMRTMQAPQNTLSMQWCAEAIRHGHPFTDSGSASPEMEAAMPALDTMMMYQNVWPISYRPVAYTYGGFGVQNSDGEYNDARQAQFGATLCDFGAKLGRQDLFERGVAAVRASLTLVNIPNDPYHVYPNPNYPPGLEPENCGHGGSNEQDGRTGFDWGEGSGLAAAAELIDKYGQSYDFLTNSVRIDGTPPPPTAETVLENPTFDFSDWRMPGWTADATFITWPLVSGRIEFGNHGKPFIGTCEDGKGSYDDAYVGTLTSPAFAVSKPTIHLLVGGGSLDGVGVELIDAAGKQIAVARGRNSEDMREVVWTVPSGVRGAPIRIRIFDHETGGWGHVNVGRISCE